MKNKKLIEIGKIVKTNGIKGVCAALFYIQENNSLEKYKNFYNVSGGIFKFSIYSKAVNNKKMDLATKAFRFLIKIDGVENANDALKFINQSIYVDLNETESIVDENQEEEEFYINDLIGMKLILIKNSEDLKNPEVKTDHAGKIAAIHDFGGGPIVEIEPNKEYKKFFGPDLMFNFEERFFPEIDRENKLIYFIMPEFSC